MRLAVEIRLLRFAVETRFARLAAVTMPPPTIVVVLTIVA